VFTQGRDVDVVVVADELEDRARYVLCTARGPRPVVETDGLSPRAWAPSVEQWGAAQLQTRFVKLAGRGMTAGDCGARAALRAIAEGVTRANTADPGAWRAYPLSDAFERGGFKGRKLSLRLWNGQLRQPIPPPPPPHANAAQAPIESCLHHGNEMDPLGCDEPEAGCTALR
jgi:ABC transporter substrate binding protein (PQQ-dependent alcohol dehydrogenase system)